MTRPLLSLICLFALAACRADEEKPRSVNLGGPRQVKAEVAVTDADYVITVRMRPVRAFDAPTNAELNQEKARQYALQALARHLSDKPTVRLSVSGAQVGEVRTEKGVYTLTLRVPRRGVAVVRDDDKPDDAPKAERVTFSSALFHARRDHEDTIERLAAVLAAGLRDAAKKVRDNDDDRAFLESVRAIEQRGEKNLDALADAVRSDLLLSTVPMFGKPSERDELLAGVERQKKALHELAEKTLRDRVKEKKP